MACNNFNKIKNVLIAILSSQIAVEQENTRWSYFENSQQSSGWKFFRTNYERLSKFDELQEAVAVVELAPSLFRQIVAIQTNRL